MTVLSTWNTYLHENDYWVGEERPGKRMGKGMPMLLFLPCPLVSSSMSHNLNRRKSWRHILVTVIANNSQRPSQHKALMELSAF